MSWIFLAIISVIAISVANLFQKIALKDEKSDPIISAILFQFLLASLYFVFAVTQGFTFPNVFLLLFIITSACLYAYGTICIFRALKTIEASEMTVLSGFGAIVTIAISFIFLGDSFSLLQVVGTLLILFAVVLVSRNNKGFSMTAGSYLALIGISIYGVAVVVDSFIIRSYSAVNFLPISSLATAVLLSLWYFRRIPELFKNIHTVNKNLFIFSALYVLQAVAFYLGLERGALVGQMSTISKASIVLTVLLATFFLGEKKDIAKKIIAAILVTIGVVMVA